MVRTRRPLRAFGFGPGRPSLDPRPRLPARIGWRRQPFVPSAGEERGIGWGSQPPAASAVSLGNKGRDDLAVGMRVFHGKFGYGAITAIEGNKLEIDFEKAGPKRVLDSFVSVE